MTANENCVVVWEWYNDVRWQPYLPEMSNYIEHEHLSASPNISLGKANQEFIKYVVNVKEMTQTNTQTGYQRLIRRKIYTSPSALADCSLWQWQTDHNSWQCFAEQATQQLENAFKKKDTSVLLHSVGLPYQVCLKTMIQTNTMTGFQRMIRRIPNDYKTIRQEDACNNKCKDGQIQGSSSKGTNNKSSPAALSPKCERMLNKYTSPVLHEVNEDCTICCEKLAASTDSCLVELNKCKHTFHTECFLSMCQASNSECLQCPICKCFYGIKTGNCPPGTFTKQRLKQSLPGYPKCGTIVIRYDIKDGIQGPEHPNPGKRYTARGFPRIGYLPDNPEGRKVADLLKEAWDRRLTFTIGSSVTTAENDTVVWNEIHHKTEQEDVNGHGYPDPNYLKNVLKELEAHGVTTVETTS